MATTLREPTAESRFHADHFEYVGMSSDQTQLFKCVSSPDYPSYTVGAIYWFADDELWMPIYVGCSSHMSKREDQRAKAAELAAHAPNADEFTANATAIFNVLKGNEA